MFFQEGGLISTDVVVIPAVCHSDPWVEPHPPFLAGGPLYNKYRGVGGGQGMARA